LAVDLDLHDLPSVCWSLATSVSCGNACIFCSRIGAQWSSSSLVDIDERILVLGLGEPRPDRDVLRRLHIQGDAQTGCSALFKRTITWSAVAVFAKRLQRDEHTPFVLVTSTAGPI